MIEFYKKYFERLARRQTSILHTDEAPAFFYIKDKYNPKAFDDAIKNAAKLPAILLERYTYDLDDNGSRNNFRHINGRFTIVLGSEIGNQQSIDRAQGKAEEICTSILLKMKDDLENGGTIELESGAKQKVFFKLSNVPADPVGPMLQQYYGVTVGFIWKCPLSGAVNPADWLNS